MKYVMTLAAVILFVSSFSAYATGGQGGNSGTTKSGSGAGGNKNGGASGNKAGR